MFNAAVFASPLAAPSTAARSVAYRDAVAKTASELIERGAARTPHARWSLFEHLAATRVLLERWNASDDVALAGFVHSVYSTDAFDTALFSTSERSRLGALTGAGAEKLAYMFCAIDRRELWVEPAGGVALFATNRFSGTKHEVPSEDLAALRLLHFANIAEQASSNDGSPAPWLSHAAGIAGALVRCDAFPDNGPRGVLGVTQESEARLLAAYSSFGNADAFEREAREEALRLASRGAPVAEPMIALALSAIARSLRAEAIAYGRDADESLARWGTAWDKRLPYEAWRAAVKWVLALGDASEESFAFAASRMREAFAIHGFDPSTVVARLAACGAFDSVSESIAVTSNPSANATGDDGPVPFRFAKYIAKVAGGGTRSNLSQYPDLPAMPWHDAATFPLARALEAAYPAILAEYEAIPPERFHRESEKIARIGNWDVFMLYERGEKRVENCALVPTTAAIVEAHRTVRSMAGLVYFSRLAPGGSVAPHAGPTNMRVRLHLGLIVPDGCSITVGGETRSWTEGKCIVFDDGFEHSVANTSNRDRIVLIVDLWHPNLSDTEVGLLEGMQAVTELAARNLATYWKNNERARDV